MKEIKQRESSYELLRLISQYMIVLGHLLMVIVIPTTGVPFYNGMMFPLHVAVPCFVMISGYFGIKPSIKGVVNLLKFVIVLYVPMLIAKYCLMGGGINDILAIMFPVARTNTWFIRTYLWLFLVSPLVNVALEHSSLQKKILYVFILFVIGNYAGTIGNDVSLIEGKNIITFLFYYIIGHLLSQTKDRWRACNKKKLLLIYLLFNITVVFIISYLGNNRIVNGVYEFCFVRYNSPVLWLNAILTFILVTSIKVKSEVINKMAKSCLSIYLLHCSFVSWMIVKPIMMNMLNVSHSVIYGFISTCFVALIIVLSCIIIHFLLTPIWRLFEYIGAVLQDKYSHLWPDLMKKIGF